MTSSSDSKEQAKRLWKDSPTGSLVASGLAPGTREFFERALRHRREDEQPWLPDVIPFHSMRGQRVLEIGCGPGFDALTFIENGALYSGIDLVPDNIECSRKHLSFYGFSPDLQVGDTEQLPFGDKTFDVAYSNGVLHHVPDLDAALAEAARVLKPRGDFYLIVYHKNSVVFRLSTVLSALVRQQPLANRLSHIEYNTIGATVIVNVYSRRELDVRLRRSGLAPVSFAVRKFVWEDLPGSSVLGPVYRFIPRAILNAIGRVAGWYLIAHARKA